MILNPRRESKREAITGHGGRRSLYRGACAWHRVNVDTMADFREWRQRSGLSQRHFAQLLSVPAETVRAWDSGRRAVPIAMLQRAQAAVTHHLHRTELLSLDRLASKLGVHLRTLQAAARTGRLDTHFSVRSAFGRPVRRASRAAGERFVASYYRRFGGQPKCPLPLPIVPDDYDVQLRDLRRRRQLTQAVLAHQIGAAGKAVVYQWESRKRTPSPVFWERILRLQRAKAGGGLAPKYVNARSRDSSNLDGGDNSSER
jgi:DNA-binding transcriptional regulator YiaG